MNVTGLTSGRTAKNMITNRTLRPANELQSPVSPGRARNGARGFRDEGIDLLRHMMLSREGDRREAILLRQGKGWFHLASAGHEGIAALACHLTASDYIFPGYRDRALVQAHGYAVEDFARDFLARRGSSSEGRNLPGHVSSRRLNIYSISSPVGSQCLPAVGAAMALKIGNENAVATCHIGDAATRQGEFYEAVCMALDRQLPVVFVVEDNGYGISTPTRHTTPLALKCLPVDRVTVLNGLDASEIYRTGGSAVDSARRGDGPQILWCKVERLESHTNADDHRIYRSPTELEALTTMDPIQRLAQKLVEDGLLTWSRVADMWREANEVVRDVYRRIEADPFPDPASVRSETFGPAVSSPPPPEGEDDEPVSDLTMARAVNRIFQIGLESDPSLFFFGEDIADPKGGVFGLTRELSTRFPGRVVNSPLAEATILGVAAGMGAVGYRPVFELQFIDFILPAFNQLVSQVSNLRWRTNGDWSCPLVLYAPYGAYLPAGGTWHSQSNEGWFAHIPGLRVAVPSTPRDAAGLFWSAFNDLDPSLILVPKHLFHAKFPVEPGPFKAVPFGKARMVRAGSDVTVVVWGNCVELAEQAARRLAAERGVSVEILDLRSIVPCDWNAIAASLAKTGRLVVAQEDARTCGFGQAIIAEMTAYDDRFFSLASAPRLISRPDVQIPFCPDLETSILPSVEDIVDAVDQSLK